MLTIKEFVKLCKESLPLYDMYIEDNGMSGDYEVAEQLDNEKQKLEKILDNMMETLQTNKLISISGYMIWLQQQDKEVARTLFSCLEMIQNNRLHQISELQKEVDTCEKFLKNQPLFFREYGDKK